MSPPRHTNAGVAASCVQLPAGPWSTVLDFLCAHFPAIARVRWLDRIEHGRVQDAEGVPIVARTAYSVGARIYYYREVADEPRIAAEEAVLYADEHLVVADKPHFLAVTPSGGFVAETLLTRLVRRLGNTDLVPLHRIDRDTAGLVLFSANARTRAPYHALFRQRAIAKCYEALAAPLPEVSFPHVRRSRLVRGEPFFRMREADGDPNSETRVNVIEHGKHFWRYALEPITGRKHQLRVHMAALGAPIRNDRLYPGLDSATLSDVTRPLQLLAKSLAFVDPLDGKLRRFESGFGLESCTDVSR
ncbi:MAG: pseudouridine synthase [Pseudomonadota bacterium]|nr:pseudouridine synthase [Pseudomonadota bacterium]